MYFPPADPQRSPITEQPGFIAIDKEAAYTVRLNIITICLKFVIQALFYLLAARVLLTLLTLCFTLPLLLLVPGVSFLAIYLAYNLQPPQNNLCVTDAHQTISLAEKYANWSTRLDKHIDHAANHSLRFFSGLTTRLANSALFDQSVGSEQTRIPNNH